MIKSKKQMLLVVGAFALVLMLGTVTYAFFNYTRTGTANTIKTGRIYFNTNQRDTINLTNAFPITRTLATTDTTNTDDVVITITGDTSYSGGIEYLVTATDVSNTVGAKTVPIGIITTVSNGLGTNDDSYFTNRGGNSSIYKVLANETVSNNDQLLVGYIAPDNNQTGINGSITVRAYLDSNLIAISDTYNGTTATDNMGTTSNWVNDRIVFTTNEWNSLQTNGVSFKVKIVAQEGTWVEPPVIPVEPINATPASCFTYEENNIGITITDYDIGACGTDVIIPTTISSKSVTEIGDYAFVGNLNARLTSVSIPNSVITIGDGAFDDNDLTSIEIPSSVTTIGRNAFNLNDLTSITIPESVTTIGSQAFFDNNLSEIVFNTNSLIWNDVTPLDLIGTEYRDGTDSIKIIINNATEIPDRAFQCYYDNITEVEINSDVTTIGEQAFSGCGLTSIYIPSSVTTIGSGAFSGNDLTGYLYIPSSVTTIGSGAFSDNDLTGIDIPSSVSQLGDSAFSHNNISSMSIDMEYIPDNFCNFNDISSLESVSFGSNVQTIGYAAFSRAGLTGYLYLPDSVTTIDEEAFAYNQLTGVDIPNSVTTIDNAAFQSNNITSVTIPDSVTSWSCYAFDDILIDNQSNVECS